MMRSAIAGLVCCAVLGAAWAAEPSIKALPTTPKRVVGDFTSSNYAITFKAPADTFYCPLPDNWVGSDHGTVVFLASPKACFGSGYPSSARGFEPGDVPRIEVFYAYDLDDSEIEHEPRRSCPRIGAVLLFGKVVSLCRETKGGLAIVTASGRYTADLPSMLSVTLVVRAEQVTRFLSSFKTLVASVRPCRATWKALDEHGKIVKFGHTGHGMACPEAQWW